ncbi:MAG: hypothetical protein ACE5IG_05835 [Dehalococcoidia bacterium]
MDAPLFKVLTRGQRGVGLLETIIALGILGIIGIVFIAALSTNSTTVRISDERLQADSLARSQLEILKSLPYDPTAPYYESEPSVPVPPSYSLTLTVTLVDGDPDLQELIVDVLRDGQPVLTVSTYKANL